MRANPAFAGPVKVADLNLDEEIGRIEGCAGYRRVRALVRKNGRPLGWLSLSGRDPGDDVVEAETIRQAIADQLGPALAPDGQTIQGGDPPLPAISVVICTRDRSDSLRRCLAELVRQDYPDYEVIVVDNASLSENTARVAQEAGFPVRCVREERPGLDWARNRGIREAKYPLIAFTDDDTRPDRGWLRMIAGAFADPAVMAVTGFVAAAELETPAQQLFEFDYGGMGHGFRRRLVNSAEMSPHALLWASGFGIGANMAFRRDVFDSVGPFDTALDVGTPSRGGGDIEMFHRIVARKHLLLYEPAALVWHYHRRDLPQLERQLNDNGRSFGVYLLTCLRNRTVTWATVLRFVLISWFGAWLLRRLILPSGFPRYLIVAELRGALSSPFAYFEAQAHARRIAAKFQSR